MTGLQSWFDCSSVANVACVSSPVAKSSYHTCIMLSTHMQLFHSTLLDSINVNNSGRCLRNLPGQRLMIKCLTIIQIVLEFGNVGFRGVGENRNTQCKSSRRKDVNQQQTQPIDDTESGNRTWATFVGGEYSHQQCHPPKSHTYATRLKGSMVRWLSIFCHSAAISQRG